MPQRNQLLINFPKYLVLSFLKDWLSFTDFQMLLMSYPYIENTSSPYRRLFVYIYMIGFLNSKTSAEVQLYCEFLERLSSYTLNTLVQEPDFKELFTRDRPFRPIDITRITADRSFFQGDTQVHLFSILSQNKVITDKSEIKPPEQREPLAPLLCNTSVSAAARHKRRALTMDQLFKSLDYASYAIHKKDVKRLTQSIRTANSADIQRLISVLQAILRGKQYEVYFTAIKISMILLPEHKVFSIQEAMAIIVNGFYTDKWSHDNHLEALDILASKLEVGDVRQLIADLLVSSDNRWDEITILISRLEPVAEEVLSESLEKQLFDRILQCAYSASLSALAALIPKLKLSMTDTQQLFDFMLLNIKDPNCYYITSALKVMIALIPTLDMLQIQQLFESMLAIIYGPSNDYACDALKVLSVLIPRLESEIILRETNNVLEQIQQKTLRYPAYPALVFLTLMIRNMDKHYLGDVFRKLRSCLDHVYESVAIMAFDILSEMVIYPKYQCELDANNASVEELALMKMREMSAIFQTPKGEYISHSNLKRLLDKYDTKRTYSAQINFFQPGLPHRSKTLAALYKLLSTNKPCYEKSEIEAAIRVGHKAVHRLRLFSSRDEPRMNSATDDVICTLREKFASDAAIVQEELRNGL